MLCELYFDVLAQYDCVFFDASTRHQVVVVVVVVVVVLGVVVLGVVVLGERREGERKREGEKQVE